MWEFLVVQSKNQFSHCSTKKVLSVSEFSYLGKFIEGRFLWVSFKYWIDQFTAKFLDVMSHVTVFNVNLKLHSTKNLRVGFLLNLELLSRTIKIKHALFKLSHYYQRSFENRGRNFTLIKIHVTKTSHGTNGKIFY